jgi:hypothetical protein
MVQTNIDSIVAMLGTSTIKFGGQSFDITTFSTGDVANAVTAITTLYSAGFGI